MAPIAAQQRENSSPGIPDIGGYIKEIFTKPPQPHGCGKGIPRLQEKHNRADQRHEELPQSTTQRGEELAKRTEKNMTSLVKRSINEMEKAFSDSIGGYRGKDELPSPDQQDSQDNQPTDNAREPHIKGYIEKEIFQLGSHDVF